MIKAILFDLDNTLVDFTRMKRAGVEAAVMAMLDAGLNMTRQAAEASIYEIYRERGIEYQEVFDRFLERIPSASPRILAAAVSAYRKARSHHLQPYPGIRELLLGSVHRGIRLGVVSDAPQKQAWLRLIDTGIEIYFDTVVAFEDTGKHKPDPAPFLLAMDRLGVTPEQAIMVGDWPERDMRGAEAVGVITVFAKYGDTFGTKNAGADHIIESPLELLKLVDRIGVPNPHTDINSQLNLPLAGE